jgi:acetyl esterase/lipase
LDKIVHPTTNKLQPVSIRRGKISAMSNILQRVAPIGEARDREILKDAATYVYAQRPQGDVLAHIFLPEKHEGVPRPLVVFFHGGFWDSPTPTQFVPHCLHFASRGAVAVAAETRTLAKHGTGPLEAIEDARDLIRWLRHNADTFNLDPTKVTVGGAAGGAYLALLATLPKPKHLPPVGGLECFPQALILFSALVNTASKGPAADRFPDAKTAKRLSPTHLIRRKLPPILFFHGKSDRIIPFDEVDKFRRRLRWRGNSCELVDFERAEHSFFNFNVSHKNFERSIAVADRFLVDRGLLPAEDSPEVF